jgi:hypothetical protein
MNYGEDECICNPLGKPEGKRPPGRPRYGWLNIIKMELRETGWGGMEWIDLA